MLQSQGLRAAYTRGGGEIASLSYRANYSDTTDASTYTFTSADIGTATNRSLVVVAIHAFGNAVTSVTIGGVSATRTVREGANAIVELWQASGVSGTTGNIVVNISGGSTRCLVGVYALYNLRNNTVVSSGNTLAISGSSLSRTLNTIVDGVLIGAATANASGRTYTWTGASENYDTVLEAAQSYSAASTTTTSNTTTTVSFSIAGGSTAMSYVVAAWR